LCPCTIQYITPIILSTPLTKPTQGKKTPTLKMKQNKRRKYNKDTQKKQGKKRR
jgi:hypothetical protein